MKVPDSILIVKLSAIGDVVHSLPVLEVLRKNFPNSRIDWLVEEDAAEVIEGHSEINRVIVSYRKSWLRRLFRGGEYRLVLREVRKFSNEIRSCKYDLVIDLHGLFKSGILTGLSRGVRKIGMSGATEGGWLFYNERPVPVDYNQHAIDRYLKITEYLNCHLSNSWKGHIPLFESDKRLIDHVLDSNGLGKRRLIAINPMARWKTKLWEPERFAALADRLRDDLSCEVVFTGSEHDRGIIEEISKIMKKRPINLAGKTSLKELAYLFTRCVALVTTDTGPMHIASAMGCRVIALFGPTAPLRTGPYGDGHRVIRTGIECSPCFKKSCKHMTCMKDITVERVLEETRKLVNEE